MEKERLNQLKEKHGQNATSKTATTMAQKTRQTAVKITRDLLTKAIVYNCPRYTRNGGPGVPPHACADLDGGFTNCPGAAGWCSQVGDIFKTMVKIKNGEIIV